MSNTPAEALLEGVTEVEAWARTVEAHLDQHPLPADPAQVDRSAARLEARIRQAPTQPAASAPRWVLPLVALALAAAALLAVRPTTEPQPAAQPDAAPSPAALDVHATDTVVALEGPTPLVLSAVDQPVTLGPDTRALAAEGPGVAVLLVLEGEARIDDRVVPADHWAVLGDDAATAFPDGQLPPAAVRELPEAREPLRRARWSALPDRTLTALDRLLEDR